MNDDRLLHLAFARDWTEAQRTGEYTWSTRGMRLDEVGFIHASYPHQLQGVAERFYADVDDDDLVVLVIDPQRLAEAGIEVVDEPADPADPTSERFPHIYGPLPVAAVAVGSRHQM